MQWAFVVLHVLLPSAVAITAGVGAWRCRRLLRYGYDPRLQKLMWFYGLFAASLLPMVVWTWQLAAAVGDTLDAGSFSHGTGSLHGEFAQAQGLSFLLVAHHILMLASLAVAARAFSSKRTSSVMAAAFGLAFLEHAIWIALAVEAVVMLYLAVQASVLPWPPQHRHLPPTGRRTDANRRPTGSRRPDSPRQAAAEAHRMKGTYRSRSRLVLDLLAAIKEEGPVGVTRLLLIVNLTHGKLQELLESFEQRGWVGRADGERNLLGLTEKGEHALDDLRRVDGVMQDHGLGL